MTTININIINIRAKTMNKQTKLFWFRNSEMGGGHGALSSNRIERTVKNNNNK